MATLTVQSIAAAGVTPAYVAAAAGGDQFVFPVGKRVFVHAKNGHTSPQSVVVEEQLTPPTPLGTAEADRTVIVTNAQERMIPIENANAWVRAVDGVVQLTYTGVIALTIAVFAI